MKRAVSLTALTVVLVSLTVAATTFEDKSFSGTKAAEQSRLPSSKWRFSAHPFSGPGYESRPVVVSSVRTDLKDFEVTAARVRNISSKPVVAVKLEWSLYNARGGYRLVRRGETPMIGIDGGLPTGESKILSYPIFSFTKVSAELLREASLEGDFRLDVAVAEITFRDGSTWAAGKEATAQRLTDGAIIVKASLRGGFAPLRVTPLRPAAACARQHCQTMGDPPHTGYTCAQSSSDEYCTNCQTTCCNTLCSDPTPACNCS